MYTSKNIYDLTQAVGEIVGQKVSPTFLFTDKPNVMKLSPVLLKCNDNLITLDMHASDYETVRTGAIDPLEYISTATWHIGYNWGMLNRFYYQPFDEITARKDELTRYFKLLECRYRQEYYVRSVSLECCKCFVKRNCPLIGENDYWEGETREPDDDREELLFYLAKRVENEFPGCTLSEKYGLCCDSHINVPFDEVCLVKSPEEHSFYPYVNFQFVHALLRKDIEPNNIKDISRRFIFKFI